MSKRLLRGAAATFLCTAMLGVGVAVGASQSGAASSSLYAYPAGTGTTAGCPQSSTPAGQCSLTEALAQVAAGDTIVLAESGTEGTSSTYYVGNFDLSTTGTSAAEPVTIEQVPGSGNAIVDGNDGSSTSCPTTACDGPVLSVSSGVYADLSGVTIQDADNATTGDGGGIDNEGTLAVASSTFSDDTDDGYGGAIANGDVYGTGTLTVTSSTFSGNSAGDGGAIDNGSHYGTGILTVTSSTFAGNSADMEGGAIDNGGDRGTGTLTVVSSTFSGNSALEDGGAIDNGDNGGSGTLTVSSSTFSHDSADNGGAIDNGDNSGTGTLTAVSSTFSDHIREPSVIDNHGGTGTAVLAADIVAGIKYGAECSGTITDDGYNVDDDGTCGFTAAGSVSDSPAIDGYLGSLGNHGGPTETVPLLVVSTSSTPEGPDPALAAIPPSATLPGSTTTICSQPDQRGVARQATCDMGAFELVVLYAYPAGTATTAGCPQSSTPAGQCSLTEALAQVAAGDTIVLAESGTEGTSSTYYVGNFELSATGTSAGEPVSIEPITGSGDAILDGNDGSSTSCPTTACDGPVLTVSSGVYADLSGVTIQDADNTTTTFGGGVDNEGTLTLTGSTFSGNSAGDGGAIDNGDDYGTGILTVASSTFSDNSAGDGGAIENGGDSGTGILTVASSTFSGNSARDGGAIENGDYGTGILTVATSTFSGNSAGTFGGGINNADGAGSSATLTVTSSTFSGNSAGDGAAIDNGDYGGSGTLTVTSSTFSGNSAANYGGGIGNADGGASSGTVTVVSSTFSGNSAYEGAAIDIGDNGGSGTVALAADILAGTKHGGQCHGTVTDDGYNVEDGGTCKLHATGSVNQSLVIDGYLGQLGSYGGPTETVPLLAVSTPSTPEGPDPALAAIPSSATLPGSTTTICSQPDQRGVARQATCDMGAFELLTDTTTITSTTPEPVVGEPVRVAATVVPVTGGAGVPTGTVTVSDGTRACRITLKGRPARGSCTLTEDAAGSYKVTASYGGDTNFSSSTTPLATPVTVGKATSTTTLQLSVTKVTYGNEQVEHLSVTVAPQYRGVAPTGRVTIKASTRTLCTISLSSGKGSCRLSSKELAVGTYHLVAIYDGSRDFRGSTSVTEALTVVK